MLNRRAHRAAICLIMLLLFGPAALTGGHAAFRQKASAARGGTPRLVSVNVCGHAGTAVSPASLDVAAIPHIDIPYCFPDISALPAEPALAVASAFAGDTEKPPKA
ncbi:MAG: hypothetical protein HZA22_08345 [Nitrospirae bacterium]|nr:hypothetical protein [Nitrospirota bacterium]MBI5696645.1 hypothetical protein [Nitrospirota bacterium]